jgi:hypothetical protein
MHASKQQMEDSHVLLGFEIGTNIDTHMVDERKMWPALVDRLVDYNDSTQHPRSSCACRVTYRLGLIELMLHTKSKIIHTTGGIPRWSSTLVTSTEKLTLLHLNGALPTWKVLNHLEYARDEAGTILSTVCATLRWQYAVPMPRQRTCIRD